MEPELPNIYTVSSLTRDIRERLETSFPLVWVSGEVSNLRQPVSGHYYFTLKDANAQLRAVLFKGDHLHLRYKPEEGRQILCRGRVTVYEARGDYQLIVDYLEPAGLGALAQAFEALKTRLAAEGLFDAAHKSPLPFLPRRLALVTSPTGAAVRDFLRVLRGRFPHIGVVIYPVKVQGPEAAGEIVRALTEVPKYPGVEVIILARGGGSLEDLWPFNEEAVARAIYRCPLPVVSAVGHEVDFTISDFVADVRAPTPSAAVELVVPDRLELERRLERARRLPVPGLAAAPGRRAPAFGGGGKASAEPLPPGNRAAPAPGRQGRDPVSVAGQLSGQLRAASAVGQIPPAAAEPRAQSQRAAAAFRASEPPPHPGVLPGPGGQPPPPHVLREPPGQPGPHGHPGPGLCRGHPGAGGDHHPGCGHRAPGSRHQGKGGERLHGL